MAVNATAARDPALALEAQTRWHPVEFVFWAATLLPFLLFPEIGVAMRASNAVAIAMLFGMGWTLGKHIGRSGWGAGLLMVGLGLVLVAITIALGG